MNIFRRLLLLTLATSLLSTVSIFAADDSEGGRQDGTRFEEELHEVDFEALRAYLKTKRTEDLEEKTCNLSISGDVRTEWRHLNESCHGHELRGGNHTNRSGLPISRNDFDMEEVLMSMINTGSPAEVAMRTVSAGSEQDSNSKKVAKVLGLRDAAGGIDMAEQDGIVVYSSVPVAKVANRRRLSSFFGESKKKGLSSERTRRSSFTSAASDDVGKLARAKLQHLHPADPLSPSASDLGSKGQVSSCDSTMDLQADHLGYCHQIVVHHLLLWKGELKGKVQAGSAGATTSNQFQWLEQLLVSIESVGQRRSPA